MTLPSEVLEMVSALRELPQSWIADNALIAALEADALSESALDPSRERTRHLILAIRERLNDDLGLLISLPNALYAAYENLQERDADDVDLERSIVLVSETGVPIPIVPANEAAAHFREEMLRYLDDVLAGLDGPPPAPGNPGSRPPDDEGPPGLDDGFDAPSNDPDSGTKPRGPRVR